MLEIKKVSYIDAVVKITVSNPQRKEKDEKECRELPLPSFGECLQELTCVQQYLPVDNSKIEETTCKSVSIKYDAGSPVSVIIGLTFLLKDEGGAWNVTSKKITLSESALISSHIENVITEAKKYLNYERAQGEFFNGDTDEPKTENDEAHKHTESVKETKKAK